jgi:16S rRNA (adenine1518-N6/adenine1519-N6)-dimethyltransferase
MIDANLLKIVAEAGKIQSEDVVIEVGAGTGTLTDELMARAGTLIAVEIDRDLAGLLRQRFSANPKFELIEGDALSGQHQLNAALRDRIAATLSAGRRLKLVSNLPYNIATPLIIQMLIAGVELLAFTVQREVAERLRAESGDPAYGGLSVLVQLLSRVELLRTLPPQAFWPAPRVDSALVRLTRDNQLGERAHEFSRFLGQLFSTRRKTLRKSLAHAGYASAEPILKELEIDSRLRPEALSPPQLLKLHDALH